MYECYTFNFGNQPIHSNFSVVFFFFWQSIIRTHECYSNNNGVQHNGFKEVEWRKKNKILKQKTKTKKKNAVWAPRNAHKNYHYQLKFYGLLRFLEKTQKKNERKIVFSFESILEVCGCWNCRIILIFILFLILFICAINIFVERMKK